MAEQKKRGRKSKAEKLEKLLNEVDEEIEKVQKAKEEEPENLEFPPITLPCRGYFREWDCGQDVKNLQLAMNRIMLANVPVTGEYDAVTMAAVEEFEKQYGCDANGKFGKAELIVYNRLRGAK